MSTPYRVAILLVAASGCGRVGADDAQPAAAAQDRCLPADSAERYFSILDPSMCIVAKYDLPASTEPSTMGLSGFTWGRHGGPLRGPVDTASGEPTIVRYDVPPARTGTLIARATRLVVPGVPAAAQWLPTAIDLPFNGWTAVSYAAAGFLGKGAGAIALFDGDRFVKSHDVPGGAYLSSTASALLHASYGPAGTVPTDGGVPEPGVYLAHRCGTSGLLPPGPDCREPQRIMRWDYDGGCCNTKSTLVGPIARDPEGNVFGTQILRSTFGLTDAVVWGLTNNSVLAGAGVPTALIHQVTVADPPLGFHVIADGQRLYVDTLDSLLDHRTRGPHVDVSEYHVDRSRDVIVLGKSRHLLKKAPESYAWSSLFLDGERRLWVGVTEAGRSAAGRVTVSAFFVIAPR